MIIHRDPDTGYWDVGLSRVHDPDSCAGEQCNIHNRPEKYHHLNLNWRTDRGILEQLCECGIGHPAPGSEKFLPWYEFRHGCCGHCTDWYRFIPRE